MRNVDDAYPLSPTQLGMLYHSILAPESGVYVTQVHGQLHGSLDVGRLKQSFRALVERHAVLRTAFVWDGLDDPLQVVRTTVEVPFLTMDWSDVTEEQVEKRFQDLLQEDRQRGFDLAQAPLTRILVVRLAEDRHFLLWTFHHIICDGWSSTMLLDELRDRYDGTHAPSDTTPYRNYVEWRVGRDTSEDLDFWKRELAGFTEPLTFPTSPEARGSGAAQVTFTLPSRLSHELRTVARSSRITLGSVFHAAWAVLLSRYCDKDDLVFGSTFSGRPADLPGVESMVGLLIHTLPVRLQTPESMRISDFLSRTHAALIEMSEHEFVSLAEIQRLSDRTDGDELFTSMIVYENTPQSKSSETELQLTKLVYRDQSNYPLALLVVPDSDIQLTLVFDKSRHTEAQGRRILAHVAAVLDYMATNPSASLGEVCMIQDEELRQLNALNETNKPLSPGSILEFLDQRFDQWQQRPAIIADDGSMTYGELNHKSKVIANALQTLGVGFGDRVGILMSRSQQAVAAMLGTMRTGAAYVPIDPEHPASRIELLATRSGCSVIVVDHDRHNSVVSGIPRLDLRLALEGREVTLVSEAKPSPENIAYIMHTSGSTGKPKGVAISHDNLFASTMARLEYYIDMPERFLLIPSLSFDSSVAGIYWTLCSGGALVIPPLRAEQDMVGLAAFISDHQITHTLCLPTLYRMLLEFSDGSRLASLRSVIVAGEAFPPELAKLHFNKLPSTKLFNEYGPTEATVWSTVYEVPKNKDSTAVPIGKPITNHKAYLLDRRQRRVPIGVPGELFVSGRGISPGYWGQRSETAERFSKIPRLTDATTYRTGDLAVLLEDGNLVFLGRVDDQIKIRGIRVEPGEIESTLRQHPEVAEVVVTSSASTDQHQRIEEVPTLDGLMEMMANAGAPEVQRIVRQLSDQVSSRQHLGDAEAE
ncbi:MAG: amino acid adenylation domain-containing protein [Rhodothermia bacterium]|nr:amino acid adenylation domain-containing protein [Rhodothermia bacterium]